MLDFNPDDVAFPNGHYIDGVVISDGLEHLAVRRPSDNKVYADLSIGCPEVVDRAVAGAERAFRKTSWATGAPRERARILRRWADPIEADAIELGRIEALGFTRPLAWIAVCQQACGRLGWPTRFRILKSRRATSDVRNRRAGGTTRVQQSR